MIIRLHTLSIFAYVSSMSRACIECGDKLFGRVDQKYCSDQCRSSYNNKLKSDANNYVRNINNILRKNRRILEKFNPEGKTVKVKRQKLLEEGFRFSYFTNIYEKIYHFCYDHGYLELDNDVFALVVRKEYVD